MKKTITLVGSLLLLGSTSALSQNTTNPLTNLAEYNLSGLNTFWSQPANDDAAKPFGKLFQFGRNIAFDYNTYASAETRKTTPGNVKGNDPKIWENVFFMKADGQETYDWYSEGNTSDTWTSVVSLAKDAPKEYIGTNNGDPCPSGYHMPTLREFNAFFPVSFRSGSYNGKNKEFTEDETIVYNGKEASYQANYISKKPNELIGIKFIGKDNALRTVFEWSWKDYGLQIRAKFIGNDQKYTDLSSVITDEKFWESGDIVTRFIPASGHISYGYATSKQKRDDIYLWAADASEKAGFAKSVWAFPYDDDFGEGGVSTYSEALGRGSAGAIRCVKNSTKPDGFYSPTINQEVSLFSEGNGLYTLSIDSKDLDKTFAIYNMGGMLVKKGVAKQLIQTIDLNDLNSGIHIFSINGKSAKFIVNK